MKDFVNENIKNLQPYEVPRLEYDIKLDANENPYSIPEILNSDLKEELKESIFKALWNYYPDAEAFDLREAIAARCGVKKENIILGNGSDEIILNLMLTYLNSDKKLVIHPPTFSVYKIFAQIVNGKTVEVPLLPGFELDRVGMVREAEKEETALTFITYPNNPTGNLFNEDDVEAVIKAAKGIVVIDEAYYEFAKKSFINKLSQYKNMVILRTFSKAFGIAGLRVGYMIADETITNEVNKVRLPYNLNKISQIVALKMINNDAEFKEMIEEILEERDSLFEKLSKIEGIELFKSDTNSVFFKSSKAAVIYEELLKNKILVRKFSGTLKDYIRISIGKKEDNRKVYEVIEKIFAV